jgi:hypothetical protein
MTPLELFLAQVIAFAVGETIKDILADLPEIRTALAQANETTVVTVGPDPKVNDAFAESIKADIAAGRTAVGQPAGQ